MNKNTSYLAILPILLLAILACSFGASDAQVPADVLFQDDFSDSSSGWDQYDGPEGVTDYTDGEYRIYINDTESDYWANPGLEIEDARIEVEARKAGGTDNNDFGVICRYQDVDNFYFFIISSDGFYAIGKITAGLNVLITHESMEFSAAIEQGSATNKIQAACIGDLLTLTVNGQQLAEVTDSAFTSGDVGLIAGTFDTAGTDIYFDNFVVRRP